LSGPVLVNGTEHDGVWGGVDHGFRGEFRIVGEQLQVRSTAFEAILGIDFELDDKVFAVFGGFDRFREKR
jgi:hypothetical protein